MERVTIDNLGIPPLAGLCSYEEACRVGYDIETNVALLKRYNYVEARLTEMLAAHIAHTPEWEVKCAMSLHLWLDAEHSAAIRKRVSEIREPPLHLDKVPDTQLQAWLDEAIRATSTVELLVGIYRVIKPELVRAWRKHQVETNPLADHPTCRILKHMIQEEEEMIAWGEQAITALARSEEQANAGQAWEAHLRSFMAAAGGIGGDLPKQSATEPLQPRAAEQPYTMDAIPRRDQRFPDPFNRCYTFRDREADAQNPSAVLLYARLREMDVPEWMGPIIAKTSGKPWEYYVDMSRQLWDEARHAMMGEVGFYQEGIPFYQYPIELHGSMSLNVDFTPLEAHILLWGVEQTNMRSTGKVSELVMARATRNALLTTFQDYDWADEVLHAQIGRRWLIPEAGGLDKLWAAYKTLSIRWDESMARLDPLSQQEDWWPTFQTELRGRREQAGVAHSPDE
jgi:hypothetical protein